MPTTPKTFGRDKPTREMTKQERGYGGEWERISKLKRSACPICEDCKQNASECVHHITPFIGVHDPLRLAARNLVALCGPCHQRRHG